MTELRLKPKELLRTLEEGKSVDLIHRSKPVATIQPKPVEVKRFSAKRMEKIVKKLNLEPLTDKEIGRRYRKHIMEKYGKGLS